MTVTAPQWRRQANQLTPQALGGMSAEQAAAELQVFMEDIEHLLDVLVIGAGGSASDLWTFATNTLANKDATDLPGLEDINIAPQGLTGNVYIELFDDGGGGGFISIVSDGDVIVNGDRDYDSTLGRDINLTADRDVNVRAGQGGAGDLNLFGFDSALLYSDAGDVRVLAPNGYTRLDGPNTRIENLSGSGDTYIWVHDIGTSGTVSIFSKNDTTIQADAGNVNLTTNAGSVNLEPFGDLLLHVQTASAGVITLDPDPITGAVMILSLPSSAPGGGNMVWRDGSGFLRIT